MAASNQGGSAPRSNLWSFLTIAAVAAAVFAITLVVVRHYSAATDAASILGIVIPVFATVGAAVFGVTAAYQAGSSAGAQAAAPQVEQQVKAELAPTVETLRTDFDRVASAIRTAGVSEPGSADFQIPVADGAPLTFTHDQLKAVEDTLSALAGKVGLPR